VVIPYFRGATSDTFFRYSWLGSNVPEMVVTIFTQPGLVWDHLIEPFRLQFLLKLLLPVGFLALLSPLVLMIGLPALSYNLLSAVPSQSSIYFQYISPVIPFIFIAAIYGTDRVLKWRPFSRKKLYIALWLGICVIAAWWLDNPFTQKIDDPYFQVFALEQISDRAAFEEAQQLIPPDASVATMMAYAPHLSLRPELSLFYHRLWLEERPFGFPQADYLMLNLTDLRWGVNARIFYSSIETAIGHYGYEAIYYQNDVALLTQTNEPQQATGAVLQRAIHLQESGGKYAPTAQDTLDWLGRQWVTIALPEKALPQNIRFGENIRLVGHTSSANEVSPGQPYCTTLYWQTESAINTNYTVFLHLVDYTGYVHTQRDTVPALGYYPTTHWQPGEYVGDMHCIQIPEHLSPGDYGLNVGIYDGASGQRLQISGAETVPAPGALQINQISITSFD
jgi:hypothetical protein